MHPEFPAHFQIHSVLAVGNKRSTVCEPQGGHIQHHGFTGTLISIENLVDIRRLAPHADKAAGGFGELDCLIVGDLIEIARIQQEKAGADRHLGRFQWPQPDFLTAYTDKMLRQRPGEVHNAPHKVI